MEEKNRKTTRVGILTIVLAVLFGVGYYFCTTLPYFIMSMGIKGLFGLILATGLAFVFFLIELRKWLNLKNGARGKKQFAGIIIGMIIALAGIQTFIYIDKVKGYHTIDVNGVTRQYRIFIPSTYSSEEEVPLLIALHGGMGDAYQMERDYGFDAVAEKYGFIVVYPDGLGFLKYSFHVWNSGYIKAALERGTNDVLFLTTLIQSLQLIYSINVSKIYMTGHSNGGMMTYRMAGEHPELFAAVAPVAAAIGGKVDSSSSEYIIPTPSVPVSVVHVHGKKDKNVLFEGGQTQMGVDKGRIDKSVNQSLTFFINANGCNTVPTIENSTNDKITLTRFTGGSLGTEVSLVAIMDAAHFWDDMNRFVASESFKGANSLAELIWLLLKDYVRL